MRPPKQQKLGSSLVYNGISCRDDPRFVSRSQIKSFLNGLKNRKRWGNRQRKRLRLFQRIMSGVQFELFKGGIIRFMTLTSSKASNKYRIKENFSILVKRIRRKFGKFEFCRIKTPEGYGVIHLLWAGTYISQEWLSNQWFDIHNAFRVYVSRVFGNGQRISNYLLGYLGHHSEFRMSYSKNWCFQGFVREWKRIKRHYLRYFYFHGWDFRASISVAVRVFREMCYNIANYDLSFSKPIIYP